MRKSGPAESDQGFQGKAFLREPMFEEGKEHSTGWQKVDREFCSVSLIFVIVVQV